MRIDRISVHNFRGIRYAEADGLADAAVVTVSGPNGAGKSLLMEALTFLWRATMTWQSQFDLRALVGPWDDVASVGADFRLTQEEQRRLTEYATARNVVGDAPEVMTVHVRVTKQGQFGQRQPTTPDLWSRLFWTQEFSDLHAFAHVDFLPADRVIQRGEQAQVNPAVLSAEQTEGVRQQVFNSFVQQRQMLTLTGVQPFLASLDYLDMLAERERRPPSGDFEAITSPFFEATGKHIHRPKIDPLAPFGASLNVETVSGALHGLDQLSSGEQEVLALMFYVRRLSASGGLLIIDEPELHLHPSLQQSLFAVMENIADRAQIWIVTHSPKLVTTAPLSAVMHMRPTDGTDANQLTKASDEDARGHLLSDLGVHPVDALQSDSILIVEGEVDARRLSAALSLTLSRSIVYVAGSASGVEATARSLMTGQTVLPWIAVRDRDLLSDDEVAHLTSSLPTLFVWPSRTFENELLHPALLARTLTRAGHTVSEDIVSEQLHALADGHRDEVIADLTEAELKRRFPYRLGPHRTPLEQRAQYLRAQQAAVGSQLRDFDRVRDEVQATIDARWPTVWFKLMDGKRCIGEFRRFTPFKSSSDLVSAITHTLREEPTLLPPGLSELRARLEAFRNR